ncbi:unnamed protein product, partial [Heterosigma akashiwo]
MDLLGRTYKKNRVPENIDYIVIGSGIGGLWLAACLAHFGLSCLVLEQHYIAGGFQHTFRRGDYEFVPGLHYIANLALCRPLYDMVADNSMHIKYNRAGQSVLADKGLAYSHDLRIGNMPIMHVGEGKAQVRAELVKHFPEETEAIDNFLAVMEKVKWQAGQFMTFKIFPPWLQFIMSQLFCSSYIKYAGMTTEEALSVLTTDGRLKTVLSAFGGDLGESLAEGSFAMQAAVLGHVMEGCYYPQGGPPVLARGLIGPIRAAGGDVLVRACVQEVILDNGTAVGVRLANGDEIRGNKGVVSDAGMGATLDLLPTTSATGTPLEPLRRAVQQHSGGISHAFLFVGLNASAEELGLRSSSFYYIPCNTSEDMNASAIQDFYRDTLLDPTVEDVSAGIVFVSAKDPAYSARTMPGKATAVVFSEAHVEDFLPLLEAPPPSAAGSAPTTAGPAYQEAKALVARKLRRALLANFPHLEPHIAVCEAATPLTVQRYAGRAASLGLRHTPARMTDPALRPACAAVPGLYFTGQDVAFAGWAGAMSGALITAQLLLGYGPLDLARGRTLLRELGAGEVEATLRERAAA